MKQKSLKKWEVRQRLEFIESRLYWDGKINRGDLVDFFGISILQASKDIGQYQELAPENMDYDTKLRQYCASKNFHPKLIHQPSAENYLAQLQILSIKDELPRNGFEGFIPEFSVVPSPLRKIDVDTLRTVLRAVREQCELNVFYQSMTRPEPIWRWVAPHALSFDGLRWHIRAYCHETQSFRDFLLSRILKIEGNRKGSVNHLDDQNWHDFVDITIVPHPGLGHSQKDIIEHDYGMVNGQLSIKVRAASLIYFLKRLGLDPEALSRRPEEQQIVLLGKDEMLQRGSLEEYSKEEEIQ